MGDSPPLDMSKIRRLYPFASNFVRINGWRYHYLDEGSGDPLVMIHGNPTWSFYFRSLVRELSPHYRTIVPDHIGCGLSDKPHPRQYAYRLQNRIDDLDRLLHLLAMTRDITLIAHDWGGMIGMAWALTNPARVRRVVLMNTAAFFPPGRKRLPLRLWLVRNLRPLATAAVLGLNLFARAALLMASHRGLAADVRAGLIAPYDCWPNRIATLRFVQDIPLAPKDPSYQTVQRVQDNLWRLAQIPMLICWGQHDVVFDGDYLAEWRRRFPRAEVHRFADAGHYVLEDVPEKIAPLISDFLSRHPL